MKILVLHGPNLNMLGKRDPKQYGSLTLDEINHELQKRAKENNIELIIFQSNHEGALIDMIQEKRENIQGILINPGALGHYSFALRDALYDTKLPIIEVHLSDIHKREEAFRKTLVLTDIVITQIVGLKEESYYQGLMQLITHIKKEKERGT